jgi:hypothetical protein
MLIEKVFKTITAIAIGCIILSAMLHIALLASDSSEYRKWVFIQITLQALSALLLFFVRRYNPIALFLFLMLSVPFTYINAVYTNYGNLFAQLVVVSLIWASFGYLIYGVQHKFKQQINATKSSAT